MESEGGNFIIGIVAGAVIAWALMRADENTGWYVFATVAAALVAGGLMTAPQVGIVYKAIEQCPDAGRLQEACAGVASVGMIVTKASGAMLVGGIVGGFVNAVRLGSADKNSAPGPTQAPTPVNGPSADSRPA